MDPVAAADQQAAEERLMQRARKHEAASTLASSCRVFYDELRMVGFTDHEALTLVNTWLLGVVG